MAVISNQSSGMLSLVWVQWQDGKGKYGKEAEKLYDMWWTQRPARAVVSKPEAAVCPVTEISLNTDITAPSFLAEAQLQTGTTS